VSAGLAIALAAAGYVLFMVAVLCMLTAAKRGDDAVGPTPRPRPRVSAPGRFSKKEGDRQDVA
jgi:hypothetical protein